MSTGPRVIFTRFATSDSPKLRPWLDHRNRLFATTSVADDERATVIWHLVSANNREVARGAQLHGDFERATAGARAVANRSADLVVVHVSESGRGVFGWYATIDEVPALTCARWFQTDRDRQQSVKLALRSIADADLGAGARLMNPALMTGA